MGFGNASLFLKIGFILLIVALVLQILGLALPYWFIGSSGGIDFYGGLFKVCVDTGSTTTCSDVNSPDDWWSATQALEIIGLLVIVAALVLSVITLFVNNDLKILKLICWILCFCAFVFIIIGIIVYVVKASGVYNDVSWAFAITILAGVTCLAAGVVILLDWMGKWV